jgi:hypothetical protein
MLDRRDKQEEVEHKAHVEKAVPALVEPSETPINDDSRLEPMARLSTPPSAASEQAQRSGRWTPDEKILFLYGLKRFGKGRWKKMSIYLPHR